MFSFLCTNPCSIVSTASYQPMVSAQQQILNYQVKIFTYHEYFFIFSHLRLIHSLLGGNVLPENWKPKL